MQTRESIHRRPKSHDWNWQDAFTDWREVYCYLSHAGAVRWNKQKHNRRVRRQVKSEIRRGEW